MLLLGGHKCWPFGISWLFAWRLHMWRKIESNSPCPQHLLASPWPGTDLLSDRCSIAARWPRGRQLGTRSLLLRQQHQQPKHAKGMPQSPQLIFWAGHLRWRPPTCRFLHVFSGWAMGTEGCSWQCVCCRVSHWNTRCWGSRNRQGRYRFISPGHGVRHGVHVAASGESERTNPWLPSNSVLLCWVTSAPRACPMACTSAAQALKIRIRVACYNCRCGLRLVER